MSVCSDDTDVLVLCPPDLFAVPDDLEAPVENDYECSGSFLEEERTIYGNIVINENRMRRFGSADTLTPSSSVSMKSRSLHTTPSKYASPKKNLLTSESYIYQRDRDEECLREIDEYFKERGSNGSSGPSIPSLDLPHVNDFISQLEETEKTLIENSKSNEMTEGDNIKSIDNVRRLLSFDNSPDNQKALESFNISSVQSKPLNTQLTIETSEPTMQKENLLSLHNLWSSQMSAPKLSTYEEMKILKQRLEEERLRRIHCEDVIRDLQKRLLESHEKMAVALKVDEEKDAAINRLKEGWSRAVQKWKEVDMKNNELTKKYTEQSSFFNSEKESLTTTLKKYEQDLLKALNLVQDYNQEQKNGAKEKDALAVELVKVQEQLVMSEQLNKSLNVKQKENEDVLEKNSVRISELTTLCKDFKKQIKHCHNERDRLVQELEEKVLLQKKLDEMSKNECKLQDQLSMVSKSKSDLKLHYQDQVDSIVSEKQKEFQVQIVNLEKALHKQFDAKEKNIIEAAGQEKHQLGENYKLEILVIEATHREEIELYKMKLGHCNNKIEDLQKMLSSQSDRQHELAEKLHSVIQTQWKETLKVISSSNTEESDSPPKVTLKRQNTFTKGDNALPIPPSDRHSSSSLRKTGSQTYRINETPQKILPQNTMKDLLDQIMLQKESGPDESRLDVSTNSNINDTSGSSKEKFKLKSERIPWK